MYPAAALAEVLADELTRCGVTDAVMSPGSRSAPLAIAMYRHPGLRLHVRIDERSAGFLALGLAKRLGRPVPVLCTSGSAVANLHPAVLEADRAEVGLLLLTADRPPELRGTGANQTADQIKVFGGAVRFFAEVGVPEQRPGAAGYWRSLTCRAVAAGADGPVHLNLPFREPLLSEPGDRDWPDDLEGRAGGASWTDIAQTAPTPVLLDATERGVVVAGEGAADPTAAVALAEAAGWPVLAEPASNARRGPNALTCYPLLLRSRALRERLRVQQAVTVGRPTTSRSVLDLLADAEHHTVVHPTRQWADPVRTADRVAPAATVAADRACATEWLAAWQAADHAARHAVDEVLTGDDALTEARLARDLPATLDAGAMLFLGSSMAVRAVDMFMSPRRDIRLMANRGLSGIDGSVSTAVGAALAHRRLGGGPACALLGDLTFLHDQNGLVLGPHDARPDLTIIVINNNGGGIFSLLPYQRLGAEFERLFGTPHDVSLSAVADAAGWKYEQVTHASQLSSALRSGGPRIVEVRTDRSATAAQYEHLHAAVDRALAVGPV